VGFGALAPAFFALRFARFFARFAVPAKSFFALSLLRRVSSILEWVTWVKLASDRLRR